MFASARAWLAAVALACFSCGLMPPVQDGGALIVPGSYKQAAETGGHQAHVGASLPDGGLLACTACHDVQSDGFVSPSLERCRDCHASRADFHHGGDAGLPDGGQVSCLTCHPFLARDDQQLLSPWECIQCHQQPMGSKQADTGPTGRVQAIVVHAAACSYCHEPHREVFTQPTECVACHPVDLVHGAPKEESVARTCMGCHQPHRPAAEAVPACISCHADPAKQKKVSARVDWSALFPKGHVSCGSCHKPHRFSAKEVKACTSCHTEKPVLAKALNPKAHQDCISCHAPHQPKSEPKACVDCHSKLKSTHPVKDDLHACQSCHPPHAELPPGKKAVACESCHEAPTFAAVTHGANAADGGTALSCKSCHPPHAFQVAKGGGPALCRGCHREQLSETAKVRKAGHAECGSCHQGLPHAPAGKKACLECHGEKRDGIKGHLECEQCHAPHDGKVSKPCTSCHTLEERKGLHAVKKHQDCKLCHQPHTLMPSNQKAMCLGACHTLPARHDPNVERCTGCHLFVAPSQPPGHNARPEVKP